MKKTKEKIDKQQKENQKLVNFTIDFLTKRIAIRLENGEIPTDEINAFNTYIDAILKLKTMI